MITTLSANKKFDWNLGVTAISRAHRAAGKVCCLENSSIP